MNAKILILVCIVLFPNFLYAQDITRGRLNIEEEDASPSTFPYKLKVTNGSLTDNLDGTASLSTSGGSGSGTVGIGTTNLVPVYVGVSTLGPASRVFIENGNVGIDTSSVSGGKLIVFSGNVGLGTLTPGFTMDINGGMRIRTGVSAGNMFHLNPTVNHSASESVGGAFRLTNTSNTGAGMVLYTNAGASTGRLFSAIADNTAFDQQVMNMRNDGTGIGAVFNCQSDTSTSECVSITNYNATGPIDPNATTLGVSGGPGSVGVIKATLFDSSDAADAAILSLLSDDDTSEDGHFIYGKSTHANFAGDFLDFRSNDGSTKEFFVDGNGDTHIFGNVGIGTFDVASASLTVTGNVGINVTTPTAKLQVNSLGDTTVAVPSGGNLGVGTTKPVYLIDAALAAGTDAGGTSTGIASRSAGRNNAVLIYPNHAAYGTGASIQATDFTASTFNGWTLVLQPRGGAVGIGTWATGSTLSVNGNASVGSGYTNISQAPANSLLVQGNVGVGSQYPGTALDVQGTSRTTGLQLNLAPLAGGNVLVSNSVGVGTWMPPATIGAGGSTNPGGSAPQLQYASNATTFSGIGSGGSDGTNIGIGTVSFVNRLNIVGNVGISTLANSPYVTQNIVSAGAMNIEGNVGIGTWKAGNSLIIGAGNVGVGSLAPGTAVDINGTLRLSNSGDSYFQGNVGIGTAIPMNTLAVQGNVGIGSTNYSGNVCVGGLEANSGGLCVSTNIGIGTLKPTAPLQIFNGTANLGIGTYTDGTSLCFKNCHATTGRCEIGWASGTLTGNLWSGCN